MPNAANHKIGAGIAVGAAAAIVDTPEVKSLSRPIAARGIAYMLGTLPDILEPATHPNHRQFFHSYTILGLLGIAMYKAYKWESENELQSLSRFALLVSGVAYVTHLLMDAKLGSDHN